jgi:hypothetical protein
VGDELDDLFEQVPGRYAVLPARSDARRDVLAHLRSLARWQAEPSDYPMVKDVSFPNALTVTFAVCHPECGAREFIVDGSTQECQHCGGLLYRSATQSYERARPAPNAAASLGTT